MSEKCMFCNKESTLLCDFPVGYPRFAGHTPKGLRVFNEDHEEISSEIAVQCSRPICEDCSIKIYNEIDICPHCAEELKKAIENKKMNKAYTYRPKKRKGA